MADLSELNKQFTEAAETISWMGENKLQTLCSEIIDHPSFKDYVTMSRGGWGPEHTLRTAFNSLNADETWQGLMAFIQTDGAIEMAKDLRPENLIDFLGETQKKMTAEDRETFGMFLWETRAGKALKENYPAAPLKMMLAAR